MANSDLMFWVLASVLTLISVGAALWPVLRRSPRAEDSTQARIHATNRVLVDQLDEIRRDRDRGLLNQEEAENARAEVARRLIALDREAVSEAPKADRASGRLYPWAMIVLIPCISIPLYLAFGAPGAMDQTAPAPGRETAVAEPTPEEQAAIAEFDKRIAEVEAHLADNPDDVRGWQLIGPIYQRLGRYDDAGRAYRKALSIGLADKTATGTMQNGLGQVMTLKAGGVVPDEALALFRLAQENVPADPTGFFFEALAMTQQDRRPEAIAAWQTVIDQFGPANPPWLEVARRTLAGLKSGGAESADPAEPNADPDVGPNAEAIRKLDPEAQRGAIMSMVAGLAERLDANPDDLSGWRRLIRSYMVLGQKSDAEAALARARSIFAGNAEALAGLDATAQENGL